MLTHIFGESGNGKTTYIIERAKELALKGEKAIIIIPEQFSFETEREIYRTIPAEKAFNIEVYSFTRLCNKIFNTYGGIAGDYISDTAKLVTMNLAIEQMMDKLSVYEKGAKSPDFTQKMIEIVDEFKTSGVTPDLLMSQSEIIEDTELTEKLNEIYYIYSAYQGMIENKYHDSSDDLIRCVKILMEHNFFGEYTVFIDGFMTYMAGEYKLLEVIISQAKDIIVSFTADMLYDSTDGVGVFSCVKETAMRLSTIAKKNSVKVSVPVILNKNYRYKNNELLHLMKNYSQPTQEVYTEDTKNIVVIQCPNPSDEIDYVCATIGNMVKLEDIRYKDIAVIARDLSIYTTEIKDTFEKYDIPYFMDTRQAISSLSIVSIIMSILEIINGNYKTEEVLSIAKNPAINILPQDIGMLENYCYIWSISGTEWTTDFDKKVQGMSDRENVHDTEILEKINQIRKAIIEPIEKLKNNLADCTVTEFANAIYNYLKDINATENISTYYSQEKDQELLDMNDKAWEIVMDIFDVFVLLMGEKHYSISKLTELFKMCVANSDIGQIPQTLDQVIIGIADRIRPNKPKVTFIIGANFGLFPINITSSGVFTDTQREEMKTAGIEISAPTVKKNLYEKFYAYFALTTPSEKLFVTHHNAMLDGKYTPPSQIVEAVLEMFPKTEKKLSEYKEDYFIVNNKTAFWQTCKNINKPSIYLETLRDYICDNGMEERLLNVQKAGKKASYRIENKEITKKLFGNKMVVSPSQIEKYFYCPFSYFCSGGLRIRPLRKVEFSPLESGTIIHYVLEKVIKLNKKNISQFTQERMKEEVEKFLQLFFEQYFGKEITLTERFNYLYKNLTKTLVRILIHIGEEFKQSKFIPTEFEFKISRKSGLTPLKITLTEDIQVIIEGVIDRVDIYEKGDKRYIRVIDYKSGTKVFSISEVANGINLQMLIYLFSLCEHYKDTQRNVPAGVLYLPVKDSIVTAKRNESDEVVAKLHQSKYKMNGIVLENDTCIDAMEQPLEGNFIPVKAKKEKDADGNTQYYKTSSIAKKEEFDIIENYIKRLIHNMGTNLQDGNIQAVPIKNNKYNPCSYCDYKEICKIQEEDLTKDFLEVDKDKIFDYMSKGGEDDE